MIVCLNSYVKFTKIQFFWKTKWTNPSILQITNNFHRRKLNEHITSFSAASARDNGQLTHSHDTRPSWQRWSLCHQIETKINLYFLKKEIINVNINVNKRKFLNVISGYIKCYILWKTAWGFLKKLNEVLPWIQKSCLWVYFCKVNQCVIKMFTLMFITALFKIIKLQNQNNSAHQQKKNRQKWCSNMVSLSNLRKIKISHFWYQWWALWPLF